MSAAKRFLLTWAVVAAVLGSGWLLVTALIAALGAIASVVGAWSFPVLLVLAVAGIVAVAGEFFP